MTAPIEDRGELATDRGELEDAEPHRYERAADLPPVQDANSGRHEWIDLRGIVSCRKCGVCRPHDWATRNMRCRGVVHVGLREARDCRSCGGTGLVDGPWDYDTGPAGAEPCDLCGGTGVLDLDAEAAPDCYERMGYVPCSCAGGRR